MSFTSAEARRRAVAQILEEAEGPVSAAALARRFSVSRQIIVGDVALLRAGGADILATPRGYLLGGRGGGARCPSPGRFDGRDSPSHSPLPGRENVPAGGRIVAERELFAGNVRFNALKRDIFCKICRKTIAKL